MANKMTTTTTHYPEIEDIRHDLDSLKDNVVELTKHIKADGAGEVQALAALAKKRVAKLQTAGKHELQKLEGEIKSHPMQSIAAALAAGVVLSFFLGRK